MDTPALYKMFDEVKHAYQYRELDTPVQQQVWRTMEALAEAKFLPAFDFFVELLQDDDWEWRLDALRCLGFHYHFPPDGDVAAKIRHILLTDLGGFGQMRMTAAFVLGGRSKWPDPALEIALKTDPDEDVRLAAFAALLALAGVPYQVIREEEQRTKVGESQPTWEEVQRILMTLGIQPN